MANPITAILSSACSSETPAKGAQSSENGEFLGVLNSNISSSSAGDVAGDGGKGAKTKECSVEINGIQDEDGENTQINAIFATCTPIWTLPDEAPVINIPTLPGGGFADLNGNTDAAESAPTDINAGDLLLPGKVLMEGLNVPGGEAVPQSVVVHGASSSASAESAVVGGQSETMNSENVKSAVTPAVLTSELMENKAGVESALKPLPTELPKDAAPVAPGRSVELSGFQPAGFDGQSAERTPSVEVLENVARGNGDRIAPLALEQIPMAPELSAGRQVREGGLGDPVLKGDFIRNQESGLVSSLKGSVINSGELPAVKLVSSDLAGNTKMSVESGALEIGRPDNMKPELSLQSPAGQQVLAGELTDKVAREVNPGAPEQLPPAAREQSAPPVPEKSSAPANDQAIASATRDQKGEELAGGLGQGGSSRQDAFSHSLLERNGEMFRETAINARVNPMEQSGVSADGTVLQRGAAAQSGAVLQRFERIQEFAENIGRHALMLIKGDMKQMTVTLIPGDLGRVTLSCRDTGNGVSVMMQAENPAACNLLQRQEADVRATLAQEGYNMTRFEVGTGNGGRNQERQEHLDWQRADDDGDPRWTGGGKTPVSVESAVSGASPVAADQGGRFWAIA